MAAIVSYFLDWKLSKTIPRYLISVPCLMFTYTLMLQLYFFPKGVEKALLYLEKEELPAHWDKALFMGLELLPSADEDSQDTDLDVSKKKSVMLHLEIL